MADEQLIVRLERLRDDLEEVHEELKSRFRANRQVTSQEAKSAVASLAETWMVQAAGRLDIKEVVGADVIADLNVEFQRLLRYADRATLRAKYDESLKHILRSLRPDVLIPLKQHRALPAPAVSALHVPGSSRAGAIRDLLARSAFIGHSFDERSKVVVEAVTRVLRALDIEVITGEKPKADRVSTKVKKRIEQCDAFVGIFTQRDKVPRKSEWTASPWVIDEKAFALAHDKKLVLAKENGVGSIGGLHADQEYIPFSIDHLEELVLRVLETFTHPDA